MESRGDVNICPSHFPCSCIQLCPLWGWVVWWVEKVYQNWIYLSAVLEDTTSCGWSSGKSQHQKPWHNPKIPDPAEDAPAHCRGVGQDNLKKFLLTQTILWFYSRKLIHSAYIKVSSSLKFHLEVSCPVVQPQELCLLWGCSSSVGGGLNALRGLLWILSPSTLRKI